jgi:hypothetical protein
LYKNSRSPYELDDDWSLLHKLIQLKINSLENPKTGTDEDKFSENIGIFVLNNILTQLEPDKYEYDVKNMYGDDDDGIFYDIRLTRKYHKPQEIFGMFYVPNNLRLYCDFDKGKNKNKFIINIKLCHAFVREVSNNTSYDGEILFGPIPLCVYLDKVCGISYENAKLVLESEMFRLL